MSRHYWRRDEPPEDYAAEIARRDELRSKIKSLGISQIQMIRELETRGMQTTRTELSGALHGGRRGPKIDVMLKWITELVERVEHEGA